MKHRTIRNIVLTAVLLSLLLAANGAVAGPAKEEVISAAVVGAKISYQGLLTDTSGNPLSGSHSLKFELYDAASGGTKLWEQTKTGVQVQNGLFDVQLDIDPADFDGQALWLAIRVDGQLLSPRQEMLPAPYALSLRPGAEIVGDVDGSEALLVRNSSSTDHSVGVEGYASATSGRNYGVRGLSDSTGGRGMFGWATAASGETYGVLGRSESNAGVGVIAFATSASGKTYGVWGESRSTDGGTGVYGTAPITGVVGIATASSGETHGVHGQTDSSSDYATGVYGYASAASGRTYAVRGLNDSVGGRGVYGWATAASGETIGVYGRTESNSDYSEGVYGYAAGSSGKTRGVLGLTNSSSDYAAGVYGWANRGSGETYGVYGGISSSSDYAAGVRGYASRGSGETYGVYGDTASSSDRAAGVYGYAGAASGETCGVVGVSDSNAGVGVSASANSASGETYGLWGKSYSTDGGTGVYGTAPITGVVGIATASSGETYGVYGQGNRWGVYGTGEWGVQGSGVIGVIGEGLCGVQGHGGVTGVQGTTDYTSDDATGVHGYATASSGATRGVYGRTDSSTDCAAGVRGYASAASGKTYGVYGETDSSTYGTAGVLGVANSKTGNVYGVRGESHSTDGGVAVMGHNYGNYWAGYFDTDDWMGLSVWNDSEAYPTLEAVNQGTGPAGKFWGDVQVLGNLTKSGGGFKIDHPLDPENLYLNHSFVESPQRMNVYNGNVVLDADGKVWVRLPGYFQALNQDFTYQLTPVGAPAPNLYIAAEISGNRFKIAGGPAGVKVSWQVTGVRHDPWASANLISVEEEKPQSERGLYLHPEVYGLPRHMAAKIPEYAEAKPPDGGGR